MKSNSVYKDAGKVCAVIFLFGLIEFIIFTICMSFRVDVLIGVLYGCAFTSLSFFYLAYSVKKSMEKESRGAKMNMAASYSFRLIAVAVMFVAASNTDFIHLWAAIIPLFFQRIAVHIVGIMNSHSSKGSDNS